MPRAADLIILAGLTLLAGCGDQLLHATTGVMPTERDQAVAWFPLTDGRAVGRDLSPHHTDAFAIKIVVETDPVRGPVANFNVPEVIGAALVILTPIRRDFTVAFWIRTAQLGPAQMGWVMGPRLVDGDSPGLALDFGLSLSGDKLAFGVGDPNDTPRDQTAMKSRVGICDDRWHHVAITRSGDSGLRQIFIDGLLDSEEAALPGDLVLPPSILVGQRISTLPASPPVRARLSDLLFFDRVLPPATIATLAKP
jgi:hypothetical protein